MEAKKTQTQIIKESIARRAKYRVGKMILCPWDVGPHPSNRAGEACKSLRTRELNGKLAVEGFDPVEANSNGVAVECDLAVAGNEWKKTRFQE